MLQVIDDTFPPVSQKDRKSTCSPSIGQALPRFCRCSPLGRKSVRMPG